MGKKSKPPPAPNYTALAEQTAASDAAAAEKALIANRPTQETPWGSNSWSQGADGQWKQTTTLAPEEQARLDAQRQTSAGLSQGMGSLINASNAAMANQIKPGEMYSPDGRGFQDYNPQGAREGTGSMGQATGPEGLMGLGSLTQQGTGSMGSMSGNYGPGGNYSMGGLGSLGQLGQAGSMGQLGSNGQISNMSGNYGQMGQLGQSGQMGQLGQSGQMGQLPANTGEMGKL